MGSSETEMTEQTLPMNPAAAENEESCGNISPGNTEQARGVVTPKQGCCLDGFCNNGKVKIGSFVLNVILIISIIACIVLLAQPSPSTPTECCPDGWIGYQRKCYYFSDSSRTWNSSQNYCASFNASLVVIDSEEEMSFLRRHKGPADHWIGLQRTDDQEPWRWINGTIFNMNATAFFRFEIRSRGECAYINQQGVASSSSQSEGPWICSKPVHR